MKKVISAILVLTLAWNYGFSYTFINSLPMKANVYIDEKSAGQTPLIIKEDVSGAHVIRFELMGYYSSSINVSISSGITNLYSILTPQTFSLYLPGQQSIVINDKPYKSEEIKNLPEGYYHFKPGQDAVTMQRLNPNEKFLWISAGVGIVGLAAGLIGSMSANDSYTKYQEASQYEDVVRYMQAATFWDSVSMFGWVMTGLGAGATVYFAFDSYNFNQQNKAIKVASESIKEEDVQLYEKAMDLNSQGDMPGAVKIFEQILWSYPNSRFIPGTLFRLAQIAFEKKDYGKAVEYLERIKREYPIYEIYEISMKYLGDCYSAQQRFEQAIPTYLEINNLNQFYSKESIDYTVIDNTYLQYKKNKDVKLKEQVKNLIDKFMQNTSYSQESKNSLQNMKID